MLTKRIIACLDVDAGRVVKGVKFENLRDAGDPAQLAKAHSESGADEIVLLDISATHEGRATLLDTVRRTAKQLFIPFTVGGGIRTLSDAADVFDAGADKISINSAASRRPSFDHFVSQSALARRRWLWRSMPNALKLGNAGKHSPAAEERPRAEMLSSGRGKRSPAVQVKSSLHRWTAMAPAAASIAN